MAADTKAISWLLFVAAGLGLGAMAAVLFFFDPNTWAFYPTCLFHRATGLLCPGCGSLRALHQLLHGHIAAAFRFNELLVLSLPLCAWFGGAQALRIWRGQPVGPALSTCWLWLFAVVVLVFAIGRNVPGSPLAMLPR